MSKHKPPYHPPVHHECAPVRVPHVEPDPLKALPAKARMAVRSAVSHEIDTDILGAGTPLDMRIKQDRELVNAYRKFEESRIARDPELVAKAKQDYAASLLDNRTVETRYYVDKTHEVKVTTMAVPGKGGRPQDPLLKLDGTIVYPEQQVAAAQTMPAPQQVAALALPDNTPGVTRMIAGGSPLNKTPEPAIASAPQPFPAGAPQVASADTGLNRRSTGGIA